MKGKIIFLCLYFSVFFSNCKNSCEYPVDIMYGQIDMNNNIKVVIDDVISVKKVFDYYHMPSNNKDYVFKGYCPENNMIKLEFEFNNKDTIFYIDKNKIKKCYLGYRILEETKDSIFYIEYQYKKPYSGISEIKFED